MQEKRPHAEVLKTFKNFVLQLLRAVPDSL